VVKRGEYEAKDGDQGGANAVEVQRNVLDDQ